MTSMGPTSRILRQGIPKTMRAIHYHGDGDTSEANIIEVPVPQPGAGEVLVKVTAAGINRADIMQRSGNYPPPAGASEIPGLEVSGVIVSLGEKSTFGDEYRYSVGDEVCALLAGGGYAEYAVVPVGQLLPIPDDMDLVAAAALPEVACTAWFNLMMRAEARPGDWVLVHGATGGVGSFAVQMLSELGMRVLGTSGGADKVAQARALGAEHVFDYRAAQQGAFADWALEVTEGHGADIILDVVGAPYLTPNIEALAIGGKLVILAAQLGRVAEIDLMSLVWKDAVLTGSALRTRPRGDKARIVSEVGQRLWPLIGSGRLNANISARFLLEDAAAAQKYFDSTNRLGKVLLVTDPDQVMIPDGAF